MGIFINHCNFWGSETWVQGHAGARMRRHGGSSAAWRVLRCGACWQRAMHVSTCEDCWWVPVSSIVSRPAHRIPPLLCTRLFTLSEWPMHALFVTTHHVPTLSRSHTISLYALSHCLALSRSHTESRSLSHQLPHGIFLCQRLTSSRFIPHTSYCVLRDRIIWYWATHGSTHHSTHR